MGTLTPPHSALRVCSQELRAGGPIDKPEESGGDEKDDDTEKGMPAKSKLTLKEFSGILHDNKV